MKPGAKLNRNEERTSADDLPPGGGCACRDEQPNGRASGSPRRRLFHQSGVRAAQAVLKGRERERTPVARGRPSRGGVNSFRGKGTGVSRQNRLAEL